MNFKSESKGITLVALVITIIILLILAGITINSLTGSGLFDKVKLAKEESENAEKLENETLGEYESEIGKYIDGTRNNFQSTVWYPKGTEEEPETISANQRIEIENPYPGKNLYVIVQIQVDGLWSTTNWFCDSGNAYGIEAMQLEGEKDGEKVDKIIIQSANVALTSYSYHSGNGFGNTTVITSAPYRLKIYCLD